MSRALVSGRRALRQKPVQASNVVPLHAPKETTEDIVRSVEERAAEEGREISRMLQNLLAGAQQRHREPVQECVPIGMAMDRPTLDNWIEIGQRMLGKGRRT